jgi:hypothetical protein
MRQRLAPRQELSPPPSLGEGDVAGAYLLTVTFCLWEREPREPSLSGSLFPYQAERMRAYSCLPTAICGERTYIRGGLPQHLRLDQDPRLSPATAVEAMPWSWRRLSLYRHIKR